VDERYDDHLIGTYPIDESVVPDEQLTVLTLVELGNPAAAIGEGVKRLSRCQEVGNELGGSGLQFVS
jgi:hypothetical protein